MRLPGIVGAVGLLALVSLVASAAEVAGTWKAEFDTQVGMQRYTFVLKVEGEKLTGTATFERMGLTGQAQLEKGKLDGDQVSFVETMDFQGTPIPIEYTGQLAGDEIRFTRKVGTFATEEFVARRVKE